MTVPLLERFADGFARKAGPDLRIRIFRLICIMAAGLCLLLVAPLNAFQNLPWGVHLANVVLGLLGAFCYWQSCRGRHYIVPFLVFILVSLDLVWFLNAGSDGSVTHYFYPVMLFVIALFQGWRRWLLVLGVWLNVGLLFLAEHFFPAWVTPFQTPLDRLVDLETGVFCSFIALGSVIWFILVNYAREQQRVAEIAARLAASEENYREIFNSTSDALFVHGPDGRVLDLNEQACTLFGADRARLLGLPFDDFSFGQSPYAREEALALVGLALQGQPQVFEWRSRRATGDLFWSEVALRVWEIGGEKRVIAAVRDISERKKADQVRRENEERLQLAMTASRQGWFELNVQTGQGISSAEYIRIIGFEPGEYVTTLQGWIDGIHPEERAAVLEVFRACVESGETHAGEYRRQTRTGGWKWFRSVGRIVEYDAAGRPWRMCGTHMDITERKELEAQLLHSQRLEAVGTLASGVAHDLNNILTPMLMASSLLREKLPEARDRELMSLLDEGGKRGAAIVKQLLAFSRNLAQDRVPVDPRQLLREMAQLMRSTFPKEIRVVEAAAADLGLVEAEPNQLHQVLLNLCVNARDAMPAGGILTLGLERVELPPRVGAKDGAAKGGPYLVISVADTGHGIPPDIMDRIFDPFFTTKPVGRGTGLGLASVHGIVKAHHGFVRVESAPGCGANFRVFLPAPVAVAPLRPPGAVASAAPVPVPAGSGACILVVDDEPAVLLVTCRVMERMGYRVAQASSGAEALAVLRQRQEEVALVITDFAMPGMDGPTLAPLLRAISPSLRLIGVSGLSQSHRAGELRGLGFCELLSKPYELDDLVRAVQRQFPAPPPAS